MKYLIPFLLLIFSSCSFFEKDAKKVASKPTIVKECLKTDDCEIGKVFLITKDIPTFEAAGGKETGVLKEGYVQVLNLERWNYSESDIQTWFQVQTRDQKKYWIRNDQGLESLEFISDEDLESIKNEGVRSKEFKSLSEREMLKKVGSEDFELTAHYKVEKIFDQKVPIFLEGAMTFSDRNNEKVTGVYYFPSCTSLEKILRAKMEYKTVGTKPFQIRYNNLFTEKNGELVTTSFLDDCLSYVDNNAATCPNYGSSYQKLESKVGSLAVFENGSMGGGGCGNTYTSTLIKTIDLKSGKEAVLTDYFDEKDLVKALQNDPYVKEKLGEERLKLDTLEKLAQELYIQGFGIYDEKIRDGKVRLRIAVDSQEVVHWSDHAFIGVDVIPKKDFLTEFRKLEPKAELYLKTTIK